MQVFCYWFDTLKLRYSIRLPWFYLSDSLFFCLSFHPSVSLFVSLSVHLLIQMYTYPSICVPACLSVCLSVCSSIRPLIRVSIYPSVCLFFCTSFRPSIRLSACPPFIHNSIIDLLVCLYLCLICAVVRMSVCPYIPNVLESRAVKHPGLKVKTKWKRGEKHFAAKFLNPPDVIKIFEF